MPHYSSISTPRAVATRCLLPLASIALAIPAGAVMMAAPAFAQAASQGEADSGPQSGTLMLRSADGTAEVAAIRLGSDMSVTVSGNIARVTVTQVFRNNSSDWVEGIYLYPLPEDAAVDSLKMTVGNRVIIGKIKPREEAREIYEEAKEEGKKAGLVEQQRPNMFTNSVANIGPGEAVMVAIEYQMPLKQLDGNFAMRLPLVVGPRYVPPHSIDSNAARDDAQTITAAPVRDPAAGAINPVSIQVDLAPGFPTANIASAYHKVNIDGHGDRHRITLAAGEVPQDRDFELSWRSATATPTLALFREELDGKQYVMASITPPAQDKKGDVPPREMIFVIDNSGSMSGTSMEEAKKSLLHGLGTLNARDHFNIIRFDDTMEQLFTQSVTATPDNIALAQNFTESLDADGGTEMLPALAAALQDDGITDRTQTVRQVVFLTDGAISNEQEMLAAIADDRGNSRIFMVGIGSAPNNYLMSRMASTGRGIYTNIGEAKEVTHKMATLLDMLSRPAMQDIAVKVTGTEMQLTPEILPDLYAGEPLLLIGQSDNLEGSLTISGRIGKRDWTQTINLASAIPSPSVAKLWARRRIDDVEADRILGKIDYDAADAEVTRLGMAFHLVTGMTSLVAVDETPSRAEGTPLRREDLPINLPAGWDFEHLFGGDTARAALANEKALAHMAETQKFALPQTATNYVSRLLAGLLALLVGAFGLVSLRRRKEI